MRRRHADVGSARPSQLVYSRMIIATTNKKLPTRAKLASLRLHLTEALEGSHWMGSADFLISDFPSHVTEQLAAATLESSVVIRLLKNRSPVCLPTTE